MDYEVINWEYGEPYSIKTNSAGEIEESVLKLSTCNMTYKTYMPSKMSDYDYDPSRPDRRFILTMYHELTFKDSLTDIEFTKLFMSTETCIEFMRTLYATMFSKIILHTVNNVYTGINYSPETHIFKSLQFEAHVTIMKKTNDIIVLSVKTSNDDFRLNLSYNDVDRLTSFLEENHTEFYNLVPHNKEDESWQWNPPF